MACSHEFNSKLRCQKCGWHREPCGTVAPDGRVCLLREKETGNYLVAAQHDGPCDFGLPLVNEETVAAAIAAERAHWTAKLHGLSDTYTHAPGALEALDRIEARLAGRLAR